MLKSVAVPKNAAVSKNVARTAVAGSKRIRGRKKKNWVKMTDFFLEAYLASGTYFITVCQRRVLCSLLKLTSREREQSEIKKGLYEK